MFFEAKGRLLAELTPFDLNPWSCAQRWFLNVRTADRDSIGSDPQLWTIVPPDRNQVDFRRESNHRQSSPIPALEQVRRPRRKGLRTRNQESEGIGQPINYIKCEADGEGILDLVLRDAGSQHLAHVIGTDRVLPG